MTQTKITTIEEFSAILKTPNQTYHDFAIALKDGVFSKKEIALNEDGTYFILNNIDGTTQNLTIPQIFDEDFTNIGKALNNGAFYHLNY